MSIRNITFENYTTNMPNNDEMAAANALGRDSVIDYMERFINSKLDRTLPDKDLMVAYQMKRSNIHSQYIGMRRDRAREDAREARAAAAKAIALIPIAGIKRPRYED